MPFWSVPILIPGVGLELLSSKLATRYGGFQDPDAKAFRPVAKPC